MPQKLQKQLGALTVNEGATWWPESWDMVREVIATGTPPAGWDIVYNGETPAGANPADASNPQPLDEKG